MSESLDRSDAGSVSSDASGFQNMTSLCTRCLLHPETPTSRCISSQCGSVTRETLPTCKHAGMVPPFQSSSALLFTFRLCSSEEAGEMGSRVSLLINTDQCCASFGTIEPPDEAWRTQRRRAVEHQTRRQVGTCCSSDKTSRPSFTM